MHAGADTQPGPSGEGAEGASANDGGDSGSPPAPDTASGTEPGPALPDEDADGAPEAAAGGSSPRSEEGAAREASIEAAEAEDALPERIFPFPPGLRPQLTRWIARATARVKELEAAAHAAARLHGGARGVSMSLLPGLVRAARRYRGTLPWLRPVRVLWRNEVARS